MKRPAFDTAGKTLALSGILTLGISTVALSFKNITRLLITICTFVIGTAELYAGIFMMIKYRKSIYGGKIIDLIDDEGYDIGE